ncbi:MAG: hypothetical protein KJ645_06280 [Planctomycetes bacterium]|nr:hypothetical protein [Planctomycetota bacterium]
MECNSTYPMPKPSTVGTVLGDLIGKEVAVQKCEPFPLGPDHPFTVVLFRDDSGYPGAVMICDLALCVYSGAALSAMPADEARAAVKKKGLDGTMYDNFKEVVNIVGGSLFNSPDSPHLVLREIWLTPMKLSSDLKDLFTSPAAKSDMALQIEEYGEGHVTLLVL